MLEDITIVTGSPKKAAAKAQEYLNSHPNAKILSTAATYKRGELITQEEAPAKEEASAKDPKSKADTAIAATLQSVEYGPDVLVIAITLGKEF